MVQVWRPVPAVNRQDYNAKDSLGFIFPPILLDIFVFQLAG